MKEDKKIIIALKKAHSHLKNIISMVEDKKYCVDIMQQNLAVMGLLKSANDHLLERHLRNCFTQAMKGSDEKKKRKMIDEILKLKRYSE